MNYESNLSQGLVEEILKTIYKYEESITVATAIGCLEIAKMQILQSQMEEDDD